MNNTAPTVASGTTYYMWFNRLTYTATITKPTHGSIKAETVTKTGNSTTVASGASSNGSLTIKYGDTVKATATADNGYTFTGFEYPGSAGAGPRHPTMAREQ